MLFSYLFTEKDFKIMPSTSTHKEQFDSKLKTINKSNNRLICRKHLELVKKYLSDQHQQNTIHLP